MAHALCTSGGLVPPQLEIGELLLKYGANPDARTRFGTTALHSAVMCGDEASVQLLLRYPLFSSSKLVHLEGLPPSRHVCIITGMSSKAPNCKHAVYMLLRLLFAQAARGALGARQRGCDSGAAHNPLYMP